MQSGTAEWSRYYGPELHGIEVLHAQFVAHRYARHAHDYFVVALLERGAASYWYRGAQRTASRGQVFVVNPDEPHTGDPATPSGYIYRVLYPRVESLTKVAQDVGSRSGVPFLKGSVLDDNHLVRLLSGFHRCVAENSPKAECESLLLRALAHLVTVYGDPQIRPRSVGMERSAVRKTREYMEAHYAEDVSLSKLAFLVSLSPYYFARAFEKEIGLPPHTYLENIRIRKAREFLDQGETLVSAALSSGYADQSHFTHRFKRFLGITPGQYIQESRRRHERNYRISRP